MTKSKKLIILATAATGFVFFICLLVGGLLLVRSGSVRFFNRFAANNSAPMMPFTDDFDPRGMMRAGRGNGFRTGCNCGGDFIRIDFYGDTAFFLGMKVDDLTTAVDGGQKISDVVTSKGKTTDDLKTFISNKVEAVLKQEVQIGRITQESSDQILKTNQQKIDTFISGTVPGVQMMPGI